MDKLNLFAEQIIKQITSFCDIGGNIHLDQMSLIMTHLTGNMMGNCADLLDDEAYRRVATLHYQLLLRAFLYGGISFVDNESTAGGTAGEAGQPDRENEVSASNSTGYIYTEPGGQQTNIGQ